MKLEKIILLDYEGEETEFSLENKEIEAIDILVISGDEVATIIYTDKTIEKLDSCEDGRIFDFIDDDYVITNINQYNNWVKRTSSYDYNL